MSQSLLTTTKADLWSFQKPSLFCSASKFSDLRVQLREVKENHRAVAQVRPVIGRLVLIQLALSYIPFLFLVCSCRKHSLELPLVAKSFWAGSLAGGTALEGTSGLEVSFGETEVFETSLPSFRRTCLALIAHNDRFFRRRGSGLFGTKRTFKRLKAVSTATFSFISLKRS
jgi:hypothetical protein